MSNNDFDRGYYGGAVVGAVGMFLICAVGLYAYIVNNLKCYLSFCLINLP